MIVFCHIRIRYSELAKAAVWRDWLKMKHNQDRKMIRFGRHRRAIADMDDMYVELELYEREKDLKDGGKPGELPALN